MAAGSEQTVEARGSRTVSQIVIAWLPVVAWIGAIQSFAGDSFSRSNTSRFLRPFLLWLFPDAGAELHEVAQIVIRKGAHLLEYAIVTARGECSGRILDRPRGGGGFGYDPIFEVEGGNAAMAELTDAEKNQISHRARAFTALSDAIRARLSRSQ